MAKKLNRKKNIDKKMVRFLRKCRKTKKCNLRILPHCNECEYLETCLNNRQERTSIISAEKKAKNRNLHKAKAVKAELYNKNKEEIIDACDESDEVVYQCHPYESDCPYCKECDGNCVYDGG